MIRIKPSEIWVIEPNDKYKWTHTFFTAGNQNQFESKRSFVNGVKKEGISNCYSVVDTFSYIFNRFKKGVFVRLIENKVENFVPFSKVLYKNNWSQYIQYNPLYHSMDNFLKYINGLEKFNHKNYRYDKSKISSDISTWYANNCLLRYENPFKESETNLVIIRHMFDTLTKERKVKDLEFFINKRDFPLLTINQTEPYFNIFGYDHPLNFTFRGECPVLSVSSSPLFKDVLMPTHDDWLRVCSVEDKILFPPSYKDYWLPDVPWDKRKNTAIFRGTNTGCGTTSEFGACFNQRLLVAKISSSIPVDRDGEPLLDAGITKWNLRPRKILNEKYLSVVDPSKEAPLVKPLTPAEQCKFKYVIHIDGHVSAFRLSLEMDMGCCILKVESLHGWKLWYSHLLKEYVHYIPIKSDLSDLIEKIKWCKANDKKCQEIAHNCKVFSKTYLTKDAILNYLETTINNLHKKYGLVYYYEDPFKVQRQEQEQWLNSKDPKRILNQPLKLYKQTYTFKGDVKTKVFINTLKTMVVKVGDELANEGYIGFRCINPLILSTNNFIRTIGYKDNAIGLEYVDGIDLNDFLRNHNIVPLFEIIIQVMYTLEIAQLNYCFAHNDLMPWNVLIVPLKQPTTMVYDLIEYKMELKTRVLVKIIDYGKSHAIIDGVHYGSFNFSKGQDVFMFIKTLCLKIYYMYKENNVVIRMMAFFDHTINTIEQALNLIHKYGYFNEAINAYLTLPLNNKGPKQFIDWCKPIFDAYKIQLTNSKLIFIPDLNLKESDLFKCTFPQPKDKLSLYLALQTFLKVASNESSKRFILNLYTGLISNYSNKDDYQKAFDNLTLKPTIDQWMIRCSGSSNLNYCEDLTQTIIFIHNILNQCNVFKDDAEHFRSLLRSLPNLTEVINLKVGIANNNTLYKYTLR